MSKKRVHEIAKELKGHGIELDNKEVVTELVSLGYDVKSHSSSLEDDQATAAIQKILDRKKPQKAAPPASGRAARGRRARGASERAAGGRRARDAAGSARARRGSSRVRGAGEGRARCRTAFPCAGDRPRGRYPPAARASPRRSPGGAHGAGLQAR